MYSFILKLTGLVAITTWLAVFCARVSFGKSI